MVAGVELLPNLLDIDAKPVDRPVELRLLGGDLPLINGYVLRWFASPDQVPPAADMAVPALICARLLRRLAFK